MAHESKGRRWRIRKRRKPKGRIKKFEEEAVSRGKGSSTANSAKAASPEHEPLPRGLGKKRGGEHEGKYSYNGGGANLCVRRRAQKY